MPARAWFNRAWYSSAARVTRGAPAGTRVPASTQILLTLPGTWAETWARLGEITSPRTSNSRGIMVSLMTRTRPAGAAAFSATSPGAILPKWSSPASQAMKRRAVATKTVNPIIFFFAIISVSRKSP